MANPHNESVLVRLCVIVGFGLGSKVLRIARQNGVTGGTVLIGRGTIKRPLLELLAISDVRKEIVLMVGGEKVAETVMEQLAIKLKMARPNHGIAFITSVGRVLGASGLQQAEGHSTIEEEVNPAMYQAITTIVDKGKGELVIDAAAAAGSRGGTILGARGAGIHEVSKLLAMEIEPEKEAVLILSRREDSDAIIDSIRRKLSIDEPGNGIIFVQEVSRTYGLFE
jgi:nitrogen regulatory protein PII